MTYIFRLSLLLLAFTPPLLQAAELSVAVATNFLATARELGTRFEAQTGHHVAFSAGSTGKLYAQIVNGAPYDILLAADAARPERLETAGIGVAGSRFVYARGALVAWSRDAALIPPQGGLPPLDRLHRVAIANPDLAPYGAAAKDALEHLGVWERIESRLVRGESIGQTYQFVATGNADLGLIARSQLPADTGSHWVVPAEYYRPVDQQLILLRDTAAVREFAEFLRSAEARDVILAAGYTIPGE